SSHGGIDDEGAARGAGHVLNKGADVGALDVQGLASAVLGHDRRGQQRALGRDQGRQRGGGETAVKAHQEPVLMVVVCAWPFRSKRISAALLPESSPLSCDRPCKLFRSAALTARMTSPDCNPAARSAAPSPRAARVNPLMRRPSMRGRSEAWAISRLGSTTGPVGAAAAGAAADTGAGAPPGGVMIWAVEGGGGG